MTATTVKRPATLTLDCFDAITGLVTAERVTVTTDDSGSTLTLASGRSARLSLVERGPYWYLIRLVTAEFTVCIHASDAIYM